MFWFTHLVSVLHSLHVSNCFELFPTMTKFWEAALSFVFKGVVSSQMILRRLQRV